MVNYWQIENKYSYEYFRRKFVLARFPSFLGPGTPNAPGGPENAVAMSQMILNTAHTHFYSSDSGINSLQRFFLILLIDAGVQGKVLCGPGPNANSEWLSIL